MRGVVDMCPAEKMLMCLFSRSIFIGDHQLCGLIVFLYHVPWRCRAFRLNELAPPPQPTTFFVGWQHAVRSFTSIGHEKTALSSSFSFFLLHFKNVYSLFIFLNELSCFCVCDGAGPVVDCSRPRDGRTHTRKFRIAAGAGCRKSARISHRQQTAPPRISCGSSYCCCCCCGLSIYNLTRYIPRK